MSSSSFGGNYIFCIFDLVPLANMLTIWFQMEKSFICSIMDCQCRTTLLALGLLHQLWHPLWSIYNNKLFNSTDNTSLTLTSHNWSGKKPKKNGPRNMSYITAIFHSKRTAHAQFTCWSNYKKTCPSSSRSFLLLSFPHLFHPNPGYDSPQIETFSNILWRQLLPFSQSEEALSLMY